MSKGKKSRRDKKPKTGLLQRRREAIRKREIAEEAQVVYHAFYDLIAAIMAYSEGKTDVDRFKLEIPKLAHPLESLPYGFSLAREELRRASPFNLEAIENAAAQAYDSLMPAATDNGETDAEGTG